MSQKKEQKSEGKPAAGPLRKHRTRAEKIDDLKKQISDLKKAEREEQNKFRDEKLLAIGKVIWQKTGKPDDIYNLMKFVESDAFKIEYKK